MRKVIYNNIFLNTIIKSIRNLGLCFRGLCFGGLCFFSLSIASYTAPALAETVMPNNTIGDGKAHLMESILNVNNPFQVETFSVPNDYASIMENYRAQYLRVSGFEFSGLHWNTFVVIYLNRGGLIYRNNYFEYVRVYLENDDDEEDLEPIFQTYKRGTIVLKESFSSSEGKPGRALYLTGMIKREKGYDPQGEDWEYFMSNSDGDFMMRGSSADTTIQKECSNCHSNVSDRDYIFSTYYSEPATLK